MRRNTHTHTLPLSSLSTVRLSLISREAHSLFVSLLFVHVLQLAAFLAASPEGAALLASFEASKAAPAAKAAEE
tara:strand:+ start:153 stop:374 length:222 start_codon:yes stop_codon:yes gene_type:complete